MNDHDRMVGSKNCLLDLKETTLNMTVREGSRLGILLRSRSAIRFCSGMAGLMVSATTALANPTAHCGGKYAEAASLIDIAMAKYGTLYSGGLHHHRRDDIGATLDLYRFWKELPDVELRSFRKLMDQRQDRDFQRESVTPDLEIDELWIKAGWAITAEEPPSDTARLWAAWGFDVMTTIGPAVDWWHQPENFDDLSSWQNWVAEKSEFEPALDWLQTVIAASNAPWANHWHLSRSTNPIVFNAYRRLANKAMKRFETGDGIEWLVAAAINSPDWFGTSPVDEPLKRLGNGIASCKASPQDYAAYAVGIGGRGRVRGNWQNGPTPGDIHHEHLPDSIRRMIAVDYLYGTVISNLEKRGKREREAFARYRAFEPKDQEWQRMVDLAELYEAERLDQVPVSDSAYVRRAYNFLSATDLLKLGRQSDDTTLILAAFARFIALEEWVQAELLIPEVKTALPEAGDGIERLTQLSEPLAVRLSLIAIHTPRLSTIVAGGNSGRDVALMHKNSDLGVHRYGQDLRDLPRKRNLPTEYARGLVLQRDFEAWLRLPQRRAFYGMRGGTIPWVERQSRRLRDYDRAIAAPSLFRDNSWRRAARFERLIASEEIVHLASDKQLLHTASREIIRWAASKTDTWLKRKFHSHEIEAAALAGIIKLCKFESCGTYNRKPAQERAFMLLVGRMPDTKPAKETKFWWQSPVDSE